MKKLILSLLMCFTFISFSYSQNYRVLEWEVVGISALRPLGDFSNTAAAIHTELRFNINDRISLGVKQELQFFNRGQIVRGLGISNSSRVTGDYYFSNDKNSRIFAGIALGKYDNAATAEQGDEIGGVGFGIAPRIGYEFSFLIRLTAEYNHIFVEDFHNYFSLGLGFNLGGRYKKQ